MEKQAGERARAARDAEWRRAEDLRKVLEFVRERAGTKLPRSCRLRINEVLGPKLKKRKAEPEILF